MTLDPDTVGLVKALLGKGLSRRQVATETGVSRGSVNTIAAGKHPVSDNMIELHIRERSFGVGALHRCPTCGAMIYGDCLLCMLREIE